MTYTLSANVENLTLTGSRSIRRHRQRADNVLTGNSGEPQRRAVPTPDRRRGNDTYVVDDAGDIVAEDANDGTDTVQSGVSCTLGTNVENLTLTGSRRINGTGNALDNVLTGNGGNNTLTGGDGNDTLDGGRAPTPWSAAPATTPMSSMRPPTW